MWVVAISRKDVGSSVLFGFRQKTQSTITGAEKFGEIKKLIKYFKGRTLKICVFYCSNSLSREDLANCNIAAQGDELKAISLPCSGKIDIPYMVKAFETGADGVAVVTCREGECHNLEGNMRAKKRSQAVNSLLEEVGLGEGRITVIQLKDGGIEQVIEEIKAFCTNIRNMPKLKTSISMLQDTTNSSSNHSKSNADMSREKAT